MRRQGLIFGLDLTDWLLVFLIPFVAIWTGRIALARGKNPWVWGGAALVLGIPWPGLGQPILGVVPVLFLLFFVRPAERQEQPQRSACTRCASPHSPGQNFCTKCGWDLSREYVPEGSDTVLASEMRQPQSSSTATMERPAESSKPDDSVEAEDAAPEPAPNVPLEDMTAADASEAASPGDAAAADEESQAKETEPEPAPRPWGIPQPGAAPTAAVMTARGEALLNEGRLQEAIDQFTKAIALDPKHREAFERRAEAYSKQGRDERAAEDYRQIQALNAGS